MWQTVSTLQSIETVRSEYLIIPQFSDESTSYSTLLCVYGGGYAVKHIFYVEQIEWDAIVLGYVVLTPRSIHAKQFPKLK